MRVLATYSIKGGVGKTTSAVNLAYEAACAGTRVLLWDLDPQGAATYFFRIRQGMKGGSERLAGKRGELAGLVRGTDVRGLDIVPADFTLRHLDLHLDDRKHPTAQLARLLKPLADRYDLALLDCAPSISLTSESVFAAADALLVPVIPSTLSSRTLQQLAGFLAGDGSAPDVLPYFSMVDGRKRLHRELMADLAASWPQFLQTTIPQAAVVERMGPDRAPLATFAPSTPATRAFARLWAEVAATLWPVTTR